MKNAKKITSIILIVAVFLSVMMFTGVTAFAAFGEYSSGDYEYFLFSDGTVEICRYTGNDEILTIPSEIDGHTVVQLGDSFGYKFNITSVTIPGSIEGISGCFTYCPNLKTVIIQDGVERIGDDAFSYCPNLSSVTLPSSITSKYLRFFECTNLKDIYYGGSITDWDNISFKSSEVRQARIHFQCEGGRYNAVVTAPTCTEKGFTTYTCMCGTSYVDNYTNAIGHKIVTDKSVAATCTKDGKTAGSHCSVCGTVITAQTTVKATGHSYDSGKVTKEATYTATGVKTYTCKNCGTTKAETIAKKTMTTPKVSAVANTATGVKITWGKVSGAAKYRVFYKANGESTWHKAGDTTSTSYTWTGAKSGTKYAFTVRCISSDGKTYTSSYDNTGKSLTYIAAPKLSSVSNVVAGVKVSWSKVSGAAKYRVFYKANGESTWHKAGDTTSTSYTWKGAKNNKKYSFTVRCITSDGKLYTSSYDNTGKSITFLSAPTVKVSNVVAGVKISWNKVSGAVNYKVYRKTPGGSYKAIGTTTGTSFTDKTAKNNTKYIYAVRCVTKDGKTTTSSYNPGKSITFLSAPKVTVSKASNGVQVKWGKVTGAVNYKVYRKTSGGSYKAIGTTTSTSYVDKTAKKGVKYVYAVRCVSKNGKTTTSSYNAGKSITR